MIENSNDHEEPLTPEGIERQKDAAREVVKYCCKSPNVEEFRCFGTLDKILTNKVASVAVITAWMADNW